MKERKKYIKKKHASCLREFLYICTGMSHHILYGKVFNYIKIASMV